jgi:competence protein ComEC
MDEIRRRLAEIDRQLDRGSASYFKQFVTTAPLVFCATGLIAGIIIQNHLSIPTWVWLSLLVICIVALFTSLVTHRARLAGGFYIAPFVVVVCFACLGAVRLNSFNTAMPNDIRNLVSDEPILATVRGVIVTKPYTDSNEWQFSRFTHTDRGSSFYLEITEVETIEGWAKAAGLVRVRVNEPVMDLKPGDYIQMYCRLDKFENATNPGEFDIAKYLARKKVFVAASVESRSAIEPLQSNASDVYSKIRGVLQQTATQALIGPGEPQNEEEQLLLALVLGYRTNIDKATFEAFRQTGLLHFICLSGMNFAMVIGIVWWICKTAGLHKRGRAIVCMLSAVLFLMVVPENPPAFRAAVMCFAFCGAFIFRKKSNPFNSLALAAIVLLLIRPTGLFEPDWQLSFASVLGILLLERPINTYLHEMAFGWFGGFGMPNPAAQAVKKIASLVSLAFSVSLAAWLSIAGIMLYHFYTIQWLTSIWTVLVSPLIGLVSFLGYLKLIIALVSPSIGAALGFIVNILAKILILIVKLIAGLNISEILIGKTNGFPILLFYALLAFVFFFRLSNSIFKKAVCTITAVSLIVMLVAPRWQNAHNDNLTMTVLDVGHGQAIFTHLPGGTNMLFDAGSLSRSDIGSRVVTPFLRYSDIRKIDAVIISHGDIDHINGLPEIMDYCPAKWFMQVMFSSTRRIIDRRSNFFVENCRKKSSR